MAPTSKVPELVQKMLGQTLVTKQSGPEGKPVGSHCSAREVTVRGEGTPRLPPVPGVY